MKKENDTKEPSDLDKPMDDEDYEDKPKREDSTTGKKKGKKGAGHNHGKRGKDEYEDDEDMKKTEDEDEDEDEDDVEKDEGQSPEESADDSIDADSTISPNMSTPSKTEAVHGNTGIPTESHASSGSLVGGQSPSDIEYVGKSVNPALMKSPLFVQLSKDIDGMQKAMEKKMSSMEKSLKARLSNLSKALENIESFYSHPFYKAIKENTETGKQDLHKSMMDKIAQGEVQFSQ